ncbi:MAG: hypothetical protein KDA96_04995, partial [Planctomycetaceae bacterium]|nr:hypothetical protein [Planctomycetaceae bacterium]
MISTTGSWSTTNFFSTGPAIDLNTGDLTFTTAQDVNGTATVQVILRDSEQLASDPQTFVITVNAVNDVPVFVIDGVEVPKLTVLEDAGLQILPDLIESFAAARSTALDELGTQTLTWILSSATTRPGGNLIFDVLNIQPNGTFSFQSRQDTAGIADMTLTLDDNQSANNLSTVEPLTITVTEVNDPPVAITDSYIIDEGDSLSLDASSSYDVDEFFGDFLTYEWDLNGDGTYETFAGTSDTLVVSWAYLNSIGITAPATYDIHLRVTDSRTPALSDVADATLQTLIVDYGDAPDSYGTTKAFSGAGHTMTGGLFLGATVDSELDGQPIPPTTGDGADEDGVAFPVTLERDGTLDLPTFIYVTASQAGKLDAWLDWNQNGTFDSGEHISGGLSIDVVAGLNRIDFTIPAGTELGQTHMRFRISSAGLLAPTGRADDGEVEDYVVDVIALQAPVTPTISRPVDFNPGDGLIPETSDLTPTIAWSLHSANYTYDIVVRDAGNNVVFSQTGISAVSATVPTNLAAGTYHAEVIAYNRAGTPAPATTWDFKVVPLAIASPTGIVTIARPTIVWNPVAGSKTYTVELESVTTGLNVFTVVIDTSTVVPPAVPNEYPVPSDLALGTYRVRVQATDALDLPGDWSPWQSFQVKAAPVILTPSGTLTTQRPVVTWQPVVGAVRYELQLDNVTDNIRPVVKLSTLTGTSWQPNFDLPLAEYEVWVRAYNAANEATVWSLGRRFNIAPTPTTVTPTGRLPDATPTISWNPLPSAETYELIVRERFGAQNIVIHQTGLTTTTFNQPTALPLGRYSYQIIATNNPHNPAKFSPAVSSVGTYEFVITEPPVITAPQSTTFSNHPVVQWTQPLGAGNSEIWIEQVGGIYEYHHVGNIPGTSYTVPIELGIGNYRVWVRTESATTPAEPTAWSISKVFRVATPPPVIGPVGRVADATPTLTWEGVPGAQSYEIWIDNNSVPISKLVNVAGLTSLNYTITSDLPIGNYTFWVRATNAFGVSSNWSNAVKFEVVEAPVLSGPSSSTFNPTPSFSWTNLAKTVAGKQAGATSYDIQIIDSISRAVILTANGLTGTTYTVPTALVTSTYEATVRAHRASTGPAADTTTDWSAPVQFFVGGRPNVNSIGTTSNTRPTISWGVVDGASGYELFLSADSNPNVALINQKNIGSTSFTVPQALAAGTYRVWVRAINGANGTPSVWSRVMVFTIAENSTIPQGADTPILAVLPIGIEDFSTESVSVSMLPAVEFGSIPPVRETRVIRTTESTAQQEVRAAEVSETVESLPAGEADQVLSEWDQEIWWDQPVTASAVPVQKDQTEKDDQQSSASLG